LKRELRFPDGFLWGAATAAHQNEGMNVHNDFWAWEQAGNHTAANHQRALWRGIGRLLSLSRPPHSER
jgi:beta-glucosidase/6-phospho-beta-glucosidase/beta-galactosidase